MLAAEAQSLSLVELLIMRGAKVNVVGDIQGVRTTPLCSLILLRWRDDGDDEEAPDTLDEHRMRALRLAMTIVDMGADVNKVRKDTERSTDNQATPLCLVAEAMYRIHHWESEMQSSHKQQLQDGLQQLATTLVKKVGWCKLTLA